VNAVVQRLAAALRARRLPWIADVVPALGGLALHFEPDASELPEAPLEAVSGLVEECLKALPPAEDVGRLVEVPVCYEADLGLDLGEVAERTRLGVDEIVRRHAAIECRVLMVGFTPGLAYMGPVDAKLALPRRATPRPVVPAGSVAVANEQTVVYPYAVSGGWNVIGRTPLAVFDARREPPSLFAPGDRVRFLPISRAEFQQLLDEHSRT
jgi:KipI family sensor histidine kinase inhibitor